MTQAASNASIGATFTPVAADVFVSRNDSSDQRLGDLVRAIPADGELDPHAVVLAGYPDDDGIDLNSGRRGASRAPDVIRKYLYKMTPPVFAKTLPTLFDRGNLHLTPPLSRRHEQAERAARETLERGGLSVTLGGGHDYGYPDAAAYIEWAIKNGERPLILNFDAHLDVRPVVNEQLSSGTPFYRMLTQYPEVDFAEIGIQSHCNSRAHLAWARERGVRILAADQIQTSGESFAVQVVRDLSDWLVKPRSVFVSVDIDGFTSMAAPGCSQSWATGFTPLEFFACFDLLKARMNIRSLGLYEVSPPLDADDRTSKLAAQIIHRVLK